MKPFKQVDVFSLTPYRGNPVAVVLDADGLSTSEMAQIANWTNLSETTFVLAPTVPEADYRVRIFTTQTELPFAGHPTLGTAHSWLEFGGQPAQDGEVIQQCEAGLVRIKRAEGRLAFAAPPMVRSGPASTDELEGACRVLRIDPSEVIAAEWVDNGPGWLAVLLADPEAVLNLAPDFGVEDHYDIGAVGQKVGVVGAVNQSVPVKNPDPSIEVRAFFRSGGQGVEDPVTGSLNASLAQWLIGSGRLSGSYVARQGTALGREGLVFIDTDKDGTIWVGGHTSTCVDGSIMV